MITIDLITGFLGAGKTTFIRKYATHLMEPVSYTHLDVYKRQLLYSVISSPNT